MHEATDERGVARPNDEVRAALLEALDLADRAGVAVSWAHANARDGRCHLVTLQSTGEDGRSRMPRSDALRILLRAARSSEVTSDGVLDLDGLPWVALWARLASGVRLDVYTVPTADELDAARAARETAVVEAVLQS